MSERKSVEFEGKLYPRPAYEKQVYLSEATARLRAAARYGPLTVKLTRDQMWLAHFSCNIYGAHAPEGNEEIAKLSFSESENSHVLIYKDDLIRALERHNLPTAGL